MTGILYQGRVCRFEIVCRRIQSLLEFLDGFRRGIRPFEPGDVKQGLAFVHQRDIGLAYNDAAGGRENVLFLLTKGIRNDTEQLVGHDPRTQRLDHSQNPAL